MAERLEELKSYGPSIAIDDFGSGYSNFSLIKYLPIDTLKIDGSLIKEITHDQVALSLVRSIVLFSKEIGLATVAEFVENEEILRTIEAMGIDYGQGYYFAKPSPTIE